MKSEKSISSLIDNLKNQTDSLRIQYLEKTKDWADRYFDNMMEKRKKLQAKIVSASNDKFVIRIGDISKTPKVGDSLVVTIPSRAKVEMVRKTNSLSGVRITDTIARGKVIGVNEGVVTVKPMVSRTNVAKLQSLASTNTMVGVNAIENKMKTFG